VANLRVRAREEVVPAWHGFIAEALPSGTVSQAAQNVSPEPRAVGAFCKTPTAAFLRRIANGGVARPEPGTVWYAAEAARSLPNQDWCAGPLFLFAAGHFERFAATMLEASLDLIPRTRKASLVASVTAACIRGAKPTDDALRDKLRSAGIVETIIRQQVRDRGNASRERLTAERNIWILSTVEQAAFQQAFVLAGSGPHRATASIAARLTAMHPEIGLDTQRQITVITLLEAIRSSE